MNYFASISAILPVLYAIVCIVVAIAVHTDARRLAAADPLRVKVLSPELWALLCLFGSVPAVALYWAAHHSTLASRT